VLGVLVTVPALPRVAPQPAAQCSHTFLEQPASQSGKSRSVAPLPLPPMGIVLGKLLLPPARASHMLSS